MNEFQRTINELNKLRGEFADNPYTKDFISQINNSIKSIEANDIHEVLDIKWNTNCKSLHTILHRYVSDYDLLYAYKWNFSFISS